MKTKLDKVTLVDANDNVIGQMDKIQAHQGKGQLHRAISVYLFRRNKDKIEVLIQQRSIGKIVGAFQWANTVCGNVWPQETYQECALRRLRYELGIKDAQITPLLKFQYSVKCNDEFSENEIDQIFVGFYDGDIQPNPDEVQDYLWVDWQNLLNKLPDAKPIEFGGLQLSIKHQASGINLAPWFVIMLVNKKVVESLIKYIGR